MKRFMSKFTKRPSGGFAWGMAPLRHKIEAAKIFDPMLVLFGRDGKCHTCRLAITMVAALRSDHQNRRVVEFNCALNVLRLGIRSVREVGTQMSDTWILKVR